MIQINLTSKFKRSSVLCDSFASGYNQKADTVTIVCVKDGEKVHTRTIYRNDPEVLVELVYLDPDVAHKFNGSFKLKDFFPRMNSKAAAGV